MKNFNETFKNCKYLPLTREEMIDMIEGRVVRRPAIAMGSWIQPELLAKEKQLVYKEKILDVYPEDMQQFYIKKPSTFGKRGDKYTWCDVDGADPHIGRTEVVAVDVENAIEWEIYEQISENLPYTDNEDMFSLAPEEDGRYRLGWMSYGPLSRIWEYRGITESLMDMYMNPELVHHVNRRVTNYFKGIIDRCEEGKLDGVGFSDDLGMQKGPFMSPEMFKEFYFPYYKEICEYAHAKGLHVWQHSCGDIRLLIPMLIEAGVDVLHPIQKYALDPKEIVDTFGDDIACWAGMDLQHILPYGDVQDIVNETRHLIDTFYMPKKSKLILTVGNRMEDNVPIENVVTYIEEAYRYGVEVGEKETSC